MFGFEWTVETQIAFLTTLNILLIVLPSGLTVHILLHKSDPKSSLLWLALIWFAPIFGAVFYLMFGINRISRRAQNLLNDTELGFSEQSEIMPEATLSDNAETDFIKLGTTLTGTVRTHGNSLEIVEGVDFIHAKMIEKIATAQTSILLSTYIFRRDYLGRAMAQALVEADQRGVDVKVLLDGVGNGLFRSRIYRQLKKGGVEVERFLHSVWPWRMPYLNLRNHRKLLVIDGVEGFTGSLNIGFVTNLETQFHLRGPIISHLIQAFSLDWKMAGGKPLPSMSSHHEAETAGAVSARGVLSGPIYPRERLRWLMLGRMAAAKDNIRIVTPYFIPDQGLLSGLVIAALRGVKVEILLPERSNYPFADWASRRQIQELVRAGCDIYLRDDVFDHSKIITVDGQWALIGSSNWDARSLRLNFEFDIECESSDFVTVLDIVINERRLKASRLESLTYAQRSIFLKLRDGIGRLLLPYL